MAMLGDAITHALAGSPTGLGWQRGNDSDSSAAASQPHTNSWDEPRPGSDITDPKSPLPAVSGHRGEPCECWRGRVIVGGMTLAVSGATGFVAPAQRAVIGRSGSFLSPSASRQRNRLRARAGGVA